MHQLLSPAEVAIHFLMSLDPFWFPAVERLVLCAHVPGWVSIHRPVLMEGFWTAGTFAQYLSFSVSICVTAQKARAGSCFATISTEVETPIRPYCCWFGYFFLCFFSSYFCFVPEKRFVPSLLSHFKSMGNCNTFHPSQAGRAYGEDFPAYSSGTSPCFIISYLP